MSKKILLLTLVIATAMAVCACGLKGKPANSSGTVVYQEKEIGKNAQMKWPGRARLNSKNQLVVFDRIDEKTSRYITLNSDGNKVDEKKYDFAFNGNIFAFDKQDNMYIVSKKSISDTKAAQTLYIVDPQGRVLNPKSLRMEE